MTSAGGSPDGRRRSPLCGREVPLGPVLVGQARVSSPISTWRLSIVHRVADLPPRSAIAFLLRNVVRTTRLPYGFAIDTRTRYWKHNAVRPAGGSGELEPAEDRYGRWTRCGRWPRDHRTLPAPDSPRRGLRLHTAGGAPVPVGIGAELGGGSRLVRTSRGNSTSDPHILASLGTRTPSGIPIILGGCPRDDVVRVGSPPLWAEAASLSHEHCRRSPCSGIGG